MVTFFRSIIKNMIPVEDEIITLQMVNKPINIYGASKHLNPI